MKSKLFAALTIVALLVTLIGVAAPAAADEPTPWTEGIPLDVDPYYRSLGVAETQAIVEADTAAVSDLLASHAGDTASVGVGETRVLYADGWKEFTLRAAEGNAEIWVANDLSYCVQADGTTTDPRPEPVITDEQVYYLLDEFNTTIYPTDTEYFGIPNDRDGTQGKFDEWGLTWYATDNPQRTMILVYNIEDENYCNPDFPWYVAGYFWATMNTVYADRNIIHIDAYNWEDRIGPGVRRPYLYEQVIAHEYEHLIHYDVDYDEPSWVDEGLANLAGFLCGYGHPAGHIAYYLVFHRWPLTQWLGRLQDYGESYLFQLYLMEHFGGADFVKDLVVDQANGVEGIQNTLDEFAPGAIFDDVFHDWTIANYLDDTTLMGKAGPYGYERLDIPSGDTWGYSIQWSIENYYQSGYTGNLPEQRFKGSQIYPVEYPRDGSMSPYAPTYIIYKGFEPELIANFDGDDQAGVDPHSGSYEWFSGTGDLIDNTLTLAAPIALGDEASLSFWTWYEIETGWDFGFVQISTDGGQTWTSLENPHTTDEHDPQAHPKVVENLPGFTGFSDGWVEETFDLASYADETVLIRFRYITDWAYTEAGWYVDDVVISDATGTLFSDDMEGGPGNWVAEGWLYGGLLGNDFEVTLINPWQKGVNVGTDVEYMQLDADTEVGNSVLNTRFLGDDVATVVIRNRMPEGFAFPAGYFLDVIKGDAAP